MDGVDVVLGYPWMESVCIVNINVENIFLRIWYKTKITLQDISLVPQKETKKAHDKVFAGEPIATDDESIVESEEDIVESHEENSEAGEYTRRRI